MPREGFRIEKKKRMSKRAVCSYFGNRGMPISPSEIVYHAVGTFTSRKWDHDSCSRSLDELETVPALAVIVEEKPNGCCDWGNTDKGRMDIYSLTDIYGECIDDVPAPRVATSKKNRSAKKRGARS